MTNEAPRATDVALHSLGFRPHRIPAQLYLNFAYKTGEQKTYKVVCIQAKEGMGKKTSLWTVECLFFIWP